jgi:hypothetical protein
MLSTYYVYIIRLNTAFVDAISFYYNSYTIYLAESISNPAIRYSKKILVLQYYALMRRSLGLKLISCPTNKQQVAAGTGTGETR